MRNAGYAIVVMLSAFGVGIALRELDMGQVPWFVSRVSGLIAFALLSLSMTFGLLVSTKAADRLASRPLVFDIHQFLSVLVLTFTAVHAGSLMFDSFLRFTPVDVLVPFTAPYKPMATGAGVVAGWLVAAVTASFWMRRRLGQRTWRRLHYASFLAYAGALGHGIFSGTDTTTTLASWLYVVSMAAIGSLLVYRIAQARRKRGRARQRRAVPPGSVPAGPARKAA